MSGDKHWLGGHWSSSHWSEPHWLGEIEIPDFVKCVSTEAVIFASTSSLNLFDSDSKFRSFTATNSLILFEAKTNAKVHKSISTLKEC